MRRRQTSGGFMLCWSGTSAPNAATWFLETLSRFCGWTVELDACLEGDKTPRGGNREWFNEPWVGSSSSLPDEAAVAVRLWPQTRLARHVTGAGSVASECTLTYSRTAAKEMHEHTESGIIIVSSIVGKKNRVRLRLRTRRLISLQRVGLRRLQNRPRAVSCWRWD